MPKGPIRFGFWLYRVFTWDTLLPICIVLAPKIIARIFPRNNGALEITSVFLPIVAFFIRLLAGKHHIAENHCSEKFHRLQFFVLCSGLFPLALIDACIILGVFSLATPFDWIAFGVLFTIYFTCMAFAMFPGRAWSFADGEWPAICAQELIDEVRSNLGVTPRQFRFLTWRWLRNQTPAWVSKRAKEYLELYRKQKLLFEEGSVVWATLAYADAMLFKRGSDAPAAVIYARDPSFDNCPEKLMAIAHDFNQFVNNSPGVPEQLPDSDQLRELKIPSAFAPGKDLRVTTAMIFREQLPDGILRHEVFPLLFHTQTTAVIIVPCQFWPELMVRRWIEAEPK